MASNGEQHFIQDEEICEMRIEGREAVREIAFAVNFVELSTQLPSSDQCVYINLTTKEKDNYCVELCLFGFRIVSKQFDTITETESSQYYETIYALLDNVSPGYRCSFGEALSERLKQLQNADNEEEVADKTKQSS